MEPRQLSPKELAEAYLDYNRRWILGSAGLPPVSPVFEWERRIEEEPESAWPVFQEIVRRYPNDDDILEQVWYRLEQLLAQHWKTFHERVADFVGSNPGLGRVMPSHGLEARRYELHLPRMDEVIAAYLNNLAAQDHNMEYERLIHDDHDAGLGLALAVIARGPVAGLDTTDVRGPLEDVLRYQGAAVIDRVVDAAAVSGRVRRALWRMQRHELGLPAHRHIPDVIWKLVRQAAGSTTDYTSDADVSSLKVPTLVPEVEVLLDGWTTYEQNFWVHDTLNGWIKHEPDVAWDAIIRVVAQVPNDSMGTVGAGPLEDLLRQYAAAFIDRVERQAATDNRFRIALGDVWQSGMPDNIWQRVTVACGKG